MDRTVEQAPDADRLAGLLEKLDRAIERLAETRPFAKVTRRGPVIDLAERVMAVPGGVEALYARIGELEQAGVFAGTDWDRPQILQPTLAARTLRLSDPQVATLECLSQIRLLAVANGDHFHAEISSDHARHFVAQVLALNLSSLFDGGSEADRLRGRHLGVALRNLYRYIADRIGFENILDRLIEEIWRIIAQRPIVLDDVKQMVTEISVCMASADVEVGGGGRGAGRLISALYGPSTASREDPGVEIYAERLHGLDATALAQEASGFARAMHDTGLVSPYHPVLLRHLRGRRDDLIAVALGLSSTGRDALLCYPQLVHALIDAAIHPETAQAVYGLSLLLERGILYSPSLGPALWRQLGLGLCPTAQQALEAVFGAVRPPAVHLLAGVLSVLGQPLGIGQGNNPTCQAARALSMWAHSDPDYLLQVVAWAARDDEVIINFEGQPISSRGLPGGLASSSPLDVDAVSVVAVPHLDRIYMEMGRRCAERGGDPHRWINPELHGWWVGRGCALAVDVGSGQLPDHASFVRRFYASYHPFYNGGQPVIHPQPAGVAITDSAARFIGWHAIAIYRVGLDPHGTMRVYFFNPNNDSGQDWGEGVVVSTQGCGERFGESSLLLEQFASRLYLFHFDPLEHGAPEQVPEADIATVVEMAGRSWARGR